MGWALLSKPLFEHRREILRAGRSLADTYSYGHSHAYAYTDVYA
jgi:hypothetical protein